MKKLLIVIPIILLFLASGCITGKHSDDDLPKINFTTGPAYEYKPDLPDWELVSENHRIGAFSLEIQQELRQHDILDAANWEYQKGEESLYVWAKVYENNVTKDEKGFFISPFAWITRTAHLLGDDGSVGVYRGNDKEEPPLLIWVSEGETIIHIAYYNNNGTYVRDNIYDDQRFLINLAKEMLE